MRKSILIGTKEDVINADLVRTVKGDLIGLPTIKQSVIAPVFTPVDNRAPTPVRRVVTFNHPSLMDSQ